MKIILKILIAFSIFTLIGCSAATVQYQAYPDQANSVDDANNGRIYVIRPAGGQAKGVATAVSADDKEIGLLGPASYLSWEQAPGAVDVKVKPSLLFQKTVTVDVQAGQQYFLHTKVQNIPFVGIKPWMKLESAEFGKNMLKSSKPGKVK